jgi:hypothetical protein
VWVYNSSNCHNCQQVLLGPWVCQNHPPLARNVQVQVHHLTPVTHRCALAGLPRKNKANMDCHGVQAWATGHRASATHALSNGALPLDSQMPVTYHANHIHDRTQKQAQLLQHQRQGRLLL